MGWLFQKMGICIAVVLMAGCDTYGLPAYHSPTPPRPQGQAGVIDINPKFGRLGEEVEIEVTGINTSFTDESLLEFPDEPEIDIVKTRAEAADLLVVWIYVDPRAVVGVHPVQVITKADGTLEYASGFSVVE